MARPREVEFPPRPSPIRAAVVLAAIALLVSAGLRLRSCASKPVETTKVVEVRAAPDVVLAVRDLARLESTAYHIEKVIEVTDKQDKLWGLLEANDALLLVAVGEVVAGVDLSKIDAKAVESDWAKRVVKLRLPEPEIFHARLDNEKTHVYSRSTDALAKHSKDLEAQARLLAEQSMKRAALDAGILARARTQTERTLHATMRSLGFETIEISFAK